MDASTGVDAGSTVDAGGILDAGTSTAADAGPAGADASAAIDAGSASADAGSAGPDAGVTVRATVRIRATTQVFPHADNLAGQTPMFTRAGVRSLQLLTDRNDTAPVVLFDHGAQGIEVSYDDGADTVVAELDAATLPPGRYTIARMAQNWGRYKIEAAMHDLAGTHRGELENLIVMSDGSEVGGGLHDGGYYESTFTSAGAVSTTTGDNFVVPVFSTTAGASAVLENGQWAVYFQVDVQIPAAPTQSYDIDCLVNMHESFRWTDTIGIGHALGVFDFGSIYFEPVVRFGGNRFDLTIR